MADHNWTLEQLLKLQGDELKSALVEVLQAEDVALFNQYRNATESSKIQLQRVDLINKRLKGIQLTNANLLRAKLIGANLSSGNLSRSRFYKADFSGVDLSNSSIHSAVMQDADLNNVTLFGANLANVDLSRANLSRAYLNRTNIEGANFKHVIVSSTTFANTDLSGAINLDTVNTRYSSTIGIDTLYRSKGNIPEVFLRGCGVPDTMIDLAKRLREWDTNCFISYSRKDSEFAEKLTKALRDNNHQTWLDAENIPAGANWDREIEKAINKCTHVIVILSPNSVASENVLDEISVALSKGKEVIPVLIENCEPPLRLHRAQRIDLREWQNEEKLQQGIERVIRELWNSGGKEEPPPPKL